MLADVLHKLAAQARQRLGETPRTADHVHARECLEEALLHLESAIHDLADLDHDRRLIDAAVAQALILLGEGGVFGPLPPRHKPVLHR